MSQMDMHQFQACPYGSLMKETTCDEHQHVTLPSCMLRIALYSCRVDSMVIYSTLHGGMVVPGNATSGQHPAASYASVVAGPPLVQSYPCLPGQLLLYGHQPVRNTVTLKRIERGRTSVAHTMCTACFLHHTSFLNGSCGGSVISSAQLDLDEHITDIKPCHSSTFEICVTT